MVESELSKTNKNGKMAEHIINTMNRVYNKHKRVIGKCLFAL
jgi:hypothetical protein